MSQYHAMLYALGMKGWIFRNDLKAKVSLLTPNLEHGPLFECAGRHVGMYIHSIIRLSQLIKDMQAEFQQVGRDLQWVIPSAHVQQNCLLSRGYKHAKWSGKYSSR